MSQVAAPGTVIQIKVDEEWTCHCGAEQPKPGVWVAEAFIARNGHNLTNPYIYVESLHRNAEMIAIREHLMKETA